MLAPLTLLLGRALYVVLGHDDPPSVASIAERRRAVDRLRLLNEIERRSKAGPCEFVLLVPLAYRRNPDWTLDVALAHVEQAAGQRVQTVECNRDWAGAVRRALSQRRYDEVIASTRTSAWP